MRWWQWGCALALGLSITLECFAARVAKVRGKSLLIELEGEPAKVGDIYLLKDDLGKTRGIIKIAKVSGAKAIARLGRGRAQEGMTLTLRPPKGQAASRAKKGQPVSETEKAQETTQTEETTKAETSRSYWGVQLGYLLNSMDVDLRTPVARTVSMEGNSFSARGFFDYLVFDRVWFRGIAGVEQFIADGASVCGAAANTGCDVEINYLSIDAWGRYVFTEQTFRPWAGLGFGLLFPATKKSSAIAESSITNTSAIRIGAGFDWFLSPRFMMPFNVEYVLLPESSTVKADYIAIRLGFGLPFD